MYARCGIGTLLPFFAFAGFIAIAALPVLPAQASHIQGHIDAPKAACAQSITLTDTETGESQQAASLEEVKDQCADETIYSVSVSVMGGCPKVYIDKSPMPPPPQNPPRKGQVNFQLPSRDLAAAKEEGGATVGAICEPGQNLGNLMKHSDMMKAGMQGMSYEGAKDYTKLQDALRKNDTATAKQILTKMDETTAGYINNAFGTPIDDADHEKNTQAADQAQRDLAILAGSASETIDPKEVTTETRAVNPDFDKLAANASSQYKVAAGEGLDESEKPATIATFKAAPGQTGFGGEPLTDEQKDARFARVEAARAEQAEACGNWYNMYGTGCKMANDKLARAEQLYLDTMSEGKDKDLYKATMEAQQAQRAYDNCFLNSCSDLKTKLDQANANFDKEMGLAGESTVAKGSTVPTAASARDAAIERAQKNYDAAVDRYNASKDGDEEAAALADIDKYGKELERYGEKFTSENNEETCSFSYTTGDEKCAPTAKRTGATPAEQAEADRQRAEAERKAALSKLETAGRTAQDAANEFKRAQEAELAACNGVTKTAGCDAARARTAEAQRKMDEAVRQMEQERQRVAPASQQADAQALLKKMCDNGIQSACVGAQRTQGPDADAARRQAEADAARRAALEEARRRGQGDPYGRRDDPFAGLFGPGLNQYDQQYLQQRCYIMRDPQACAMLQQSQNNNPFSQLGELLKKMMGQQGQGQGQGQQNNPDQAMNQAMCGQYPGTHYLDNSCKCPNSGQWTGQGCSNQQNACQQYPGTTLVSGRCTCPASLQWNGSQCAAPSNNPGPNIPEELRAELSCAPNEVDDSQTPIAISWLCRGASSSSGNGFATNGALNGATEITVSAADLENSNGRKDLILTCTKDGKSVQAQCPLTANAAFIMAAAVPIEVASGETSKIGWIVKGMRAGDDVCEITSDKHSGFRETGRNKVVVTPPITENTVFTIVCETNSGNQKEAKVTIKLKP